MSPLTQVSLSVYTVVKKDLLEHFNPADGLYVMLNALKTISCPKVCVCLCTHLHFTHAADIVRVTAEYGQVHRLQTSAACCSKE